MVMNEVLQWGVLLALIFVTIAMFRLVVIKHNQLCKECEKLNNKMQESFESQNINNSIFAEEIAELQEELEIRNDEQIH